jgi:hypothetical protein
MALEQLSPTSNPMISAASLPTITLQSLKCAHFPARAENLRYALPVSDDSRSSATGDPLVFTEFGAQMRTTAAEVDDLSVLARLLRNSPIPDDELSQNLGVYLRRQTLARLLVFVELYKLQLDVHGVIAEFGVRWGQSLSLLVNLRGLLEPYNNSRRVLGFDTFDGFLSPVHEDGVDDIVRTGSYTVRPGYVDELQHVLQLHERNAPNSHINKFELVVGDASKTIHEYLDGHPETIFSFVYFDFDLYEPTRDVLAAIKNRLTRGSVIGFDELCLAAFPGETLAVMEELGLRNIDLRRFPFDSHPSYCIVR